MTAQDPATYTGLVLVLTPTDGDPTIAASSEPAHLTVAYMGEAASYSEDQLAAIVEEVAAFAAALDGPVVVPVAERGTLGEDSADVVLLEGTDSLVALRDGLIEASPAIKAAMETVEQFPEWTPHVTLGYPESPALGEYDADAVTFDRLSLWAAGEQMEYPMGDGQMDKAELLEDELPVDELEDDEEEIVEIPVHGVATIEGRPTGDGREFKRGALTHRNLPLPLRLETVGTHGGDTSNVVPVGRIDEMWRKEGDEYNEYRYRGVILTTKQYAALAVEGIIDGSLTGVSVETDMTTLDADHDAAQAAAFERAFEGVETDEDRAIMSKTVFGESRVCGFTIVPIPAFQEAYIGLGSDFADELDEECLDCVEKAAVAASALDGTESVRVVDLTELSEEELAAYDNPDPEGQEAYEAERNLIIASAFAPGTKDGPGWITHPVPTSRIRTYWTRGKGAAKIRWGQPGDFNRCRSQLAKYIANPEWLAGACANMHHEALGVWPGRERASASLIASGAEPAPLFSLTAAAVREFPADWFQRQELEDPRIGVVIDGDQVYGYVAQWGVCHIGIPGVCTTAPFSASNYAYFATGYVHTDDGGKVRIGQVTMDTGHASIRASAKAAAAHYDNTGAAVADVAVGEDNFGIWFAGALRSNITEDQRHALEASGRLSGDWREILGSLELVAALAVNVPGFPVPAHPAFAASGAGQMALTAAGIVLPESEGTAVEATPEDEAANVDFMARIVERTIERLADRERADDVRARLNTLRLADVRRRLHERL